MKKKEGMKIALVTGITGQDGSYLVEYLISKGYEVHGIVRKASSFNTQRIDHIYIDPHSSDAKFFFYNADLLSSEYLSDLIYNLKPDEVYNLGAQSHVRTSFDIPEYTANVNSLGTVRLLQTISKGSSDTKFYQASTSELFGNTPPPQNENSRFDPQSPYAISKLYSYYIVRNYRESHNLFCTNGILFNHESPRRGETFVTRKVTMAIAQILLGKQKFIYMGNLDSKRDWGFAPEYVEFMWKMLQEESPEDYVIGTDQLHSVREFLDASFSYVGLNWENYVKIDPSYMRPTEVNELCADSSKAKKYMGWKPKIKFSELIKIMVDADMRKVGLNPIGEGDKILANMFPNRWWGSD